MGGLRTCLIFLCVNHDAGFQYPRLSFMLNVAGGAENCDMVRSHPFWLPRVLEIIYWGIRPLASRPELQS